MSTVQPSFSVKGKTAVVHAGLEALIARESSRRLAALGASEPRLRTVRRDLARVKTFLTQKRAAG